MVCNGGFWHGVTAPFMPGVTTTNTFYTQCAAFDEAVFFKGFTCVFRASGPETALLTDKRAKY